MRRKAWINSRWCQVFIFHQRHKTVKCECLNICWTNSYIWDALKFSSSIFKHELQTTWTDLRVVIYSKTSAASVKTYHPSFKLGRANWYKQQRKNWVEPGYWLLIYWPQFHSLWYLVSITGNFAETDFYWHPYIWIR